MLAMLLLVVVGLGIYISSLEALKNLRWDFIGSLIGAAGTIFAGWLAFSAVQEQNRLAQEANIRAVALQAKNDADRQEEQHRAAAKELVAMKQLHRFLDDVIKPFDAASDSAPDVIFLNGLEQLERTRGVVAPTIPGLPSEMQHLAQSTWWRACMVSISHTTNGKKSALTRRCVAGPNGIRSTSALAMR
jgi:hypothetical protein